RGAEAELLGETGILGAERDLAAPKEEEAPACVAAHVGELDAGDDGLRGERVLPHAAAHLPEQHVGVELAPRQRARQPPLPPGPELAEDPGELLPGLGERVARALLVVRLARDDAGVDELAEARGEHGARDARDATAHVSESRAPGQQLPHDEERPALAEEIERTRDRAELAVALHAPSVAELGRPRRTESVPTHRCRAP